MTQPEYVLGDLIKSAQMTKYNLLQSSLRVASIQTEKLIQTKAAHVTFRVKISDMTLFK